MEIVKQETKAKKASKQVHSSLRLLTEEIEAKAANANGIWIVRSICHIPVQFAHGLSEVLIFPRPVLDA